MKIYNLPEEKDFSIDIMNDLKRAKRVVLISPFLSINVIKEWRKAFNNDPTGNFTIVYDIEKDKKCLPGKNDKELIESITWKRFERLHSKIYYFEFDKGYSFYHGSANLTNSGVGNKEEGNEENRNIEIMSRFTNDTSWDKNIQEIIKYYEENSINEVPCFVEEPDPITPPKEGVDDVDDDDDDDIVKEYKKLLIRLEQNTSYEHANARYILRQVDSDLKNVQGFFVSKNKKPKKYLKFHTTNVKAESAEFAISLEELNWFTGGFYKTKSKSKNRMLYLVWKLDGYYNGQLIVFQLYPIDIFNLLKKSNKTKKLQFTYKSLTLSISKEEGSYVLKRYNSSVIIPAKQVKHLDALLTDFSK